MKADNQQMRHNEIYIVAIGASAGGLEAIHEFFDNLPVNGRFAFVIIQHLSPDYKSLLVELIGKHTHMKVVEAADKTRVEENCIYVIPNNKLLSIEGGHLKLQVKIPDRSPNMAIDHFLSTLAEDQADKAVAIILSGTGTDGSKGVVKINKAGGLVMVQDPLTAKFDGMPNSAIATGISDFILAPELMPEELFNYIDEKPERVAIDGQPDEAALPEVLKLIEKHCSMDFFNYKTPTIIRRITRRMGILGYKQFEEYLSLLRSSAEECTFLGKEFLIGVTKFFRDRAAFDQLQEDVLRPLIQAKEDNDVIKIWVTACSTGEEAYSLAIMVDQILEEENKKMEVKIFASDIDGDAIEFAAKGIYNKDSLHEVKSNIREKYFTFDNDKYTIQSHLRKQIVFARHNILKDPPFIKNDLITCRNMLIYMNSTLQRKVISTLLFSLNVNGFLFLGPSESPVNINDGFREVSSKWKIFQKTSTDTKYNPDRLPSARTKKITIPVTGVDPSRHNLLEKELKEDFSRLLTEKYGFTALYVDRNFEIKEAVGDFKRYLSLPDRLVSLNILRMVGREFSAALNAAIRKCMKDNVEVALNNVKLQANAEMLVNLYVRPAQHGNILLVLGEAVPPITSKTQMIDASFPEAGSLQYIHQLEEDLREARTNLQLTVESLETANEELQSSNEELLSANEELQSSNEELQSLNEELHTLNTEHQLRIRELVELNDDLNNYFRSSEIAQVFVDKDYRIRKFNPQAVKLINLIEGDIGRPIQHISTNLRDSSNFMSELERVTKTGVPTEREVELANGSFHLMKIFPYLRQDKQIDGVVISFVDVSNVKELNSIIRSVFNATMSAVMAFRAVRDNKANVVDLEWVTANQASDKMVKRQNESYIGKKVSKIYPQLLKIGLLEKCSRVIETGEPFHTEMQLETDGKVEWYDIIATPLLDGIVMSLTNVNDKKEAEEALRKNYQELIRSKESYRTLSLELEKKVVERTAELSISEERFRLITNAISDAVWDRDLTTNTMWWSDSFFKWFGYEQEPETATVQFWKDLIHEEDRGHVLQVLNEAINRSEPWTVQYRIQNAAGRFISVLDKGMVLQDENGVPYRLLGAIADNSAAEIIQQNKALKAFNEELEEMVAQRTADLEAQKKMLETLFMQAPAMICTLKGPDLEFDLVNPLYQSLFGKRQIKGLPVLKALPEIAGQRIYKIMREVYETGQPYVGREMGINMARDENKPLEDVFFNFIYQAIHDDQGKVDGILVFAYEVTDQVNARKAIQEANKVLLKANEDFQFVTDFVPQMVWVTLPDGNHVFYSKRWYEYTGMTLEASKGEGWNNVLHPDDRERAWKVWKRSLETGEEYEIEYRIKGQDGDYRWFLARAVPMLNEEGEIVKWFGTCTDIHDQKMLHDILEQKVAERTRELQRINVELEVSNSELMQFASIASHDLKEPLRKITMFSHLMKDRYQEKMEQGAVDFVNKIIASSTRMGNLVNDLLSFTKLSNAEGEFELVDLNAVIEEVLSDLELSIQEKKAVISVDDLPKAEVLTGQMRQVFQNLLSNALKFIRPGVVPEISITARRVSELSFIDAYDENGPFVRITIKDNGIGFSNEFSEKIFTIFQRLHTRHKYEGTGIGLAITKKIIAKHQGIIRAIGKEGQGASFIIVIPLNQAQEVEADTKLLTQ